MSINTIDLVSFNVLNPKYNISLMTFKNYDNYIKKYFNNLNDKLIEFGKIEEKEFKLYRKNKLLNLIKYFIKLNKIICLQEVNDELLIILLNIYPMLVHTKQQNDDYRVIITPNDYNIDISFDLIFDNDIKKKNCLVAIINKNNKKFILFNLHIHWKSEPKHYIKHAKTIINYLASQSLPFIICGDFNSEINSIYMELFIKQLKHKYKILTNNQLYKNGYTSINTKNPPQTGWIDHFITSGFEIKKPTITKNKVQKYYIYYDALKIIKYFNKYENLDIFNSNKYVSDHKPIFISLKI
jgi:hypothetical protein